MRDFKYKCVVVKNGAKMYYRKTGDKWKRITNNVGVKAEVGKRKYRMDIDCNKYKKEGKELSEGQTGCVYDSGIFKIMGKKDYDEFDKIRQKLGDEFENIHPKIYDEGDYYDTGYKFIRMENFGESVKVKKVDGLTDEQIKKLIELLNIFHNKNTYHGDLLRNSGKLNSGNILVKGDEMKLIDFGNQYGSNSNPKILEEKYKQDYLIDGKKDYADTPEKKQENNNKSRADNMGGTKLVF